MLWYIKLELELVRRANERQAWPLWVTWVLMLPVQGFKVATDQSEAGTWQREPAHHLC